MLTLGLGTLSSCNLLYDFEQPQCEKDRDCAERGGEYATAQCVDGYCEAVCEEDSECEPDFACEASQCTSRWECPAQQADSSSAMLHLNTVVTSITGDPLPGIEVLLCANVDPDCEAPTARLQTDQSGGLEFEVTPNFGGYLQTALPGFFPQLNFLPGTLEQEMVLPPITLSPEQNIAGLASFVGAAPDAERGHIVLSMASCVGTAKGLQITAPRSDETSILYYVNGGFPTADLERTTDDGAGGFLNFRPGNATVTLVTESGEDLVKLSFTVRKGALSVLHYQPTSVYAHASAETK